MKGINDEFEREELHCDFGLNMGNVRDSFSIG